MNIYLQSQPFPHGTMTFPITWLQVDFHRTYPNEKIGELYNKVRGTVGLKSTYFTEDLIWKLGGV